MSARAARPAPARRAAVAASRSPARLLSLRRVPDDARDRRSPPALPDPSPGAAAADTPHDRRAARRGRRRLRPVPTGPHDQTVDPHRRSDESSTRALALPPSRRARRVDRPTPPRDPAVGRARRRSRRASRRARVARRRAARGVNDVQHRPPSPSPLDHRDDVNDDDDDDDDDRDASFRRGTS